MYKGHRLVETKREKSHRIANDSSSYALQSLYPSQPSSELCPPGLMGFGERLCLFPHPCPGPPSPPTGLCTARGPGITLSMRLTANPRSYHSSLVWEFSKGVLFIFASPGPTLEWKWIKHPCRRRPFQRPKSKAIFCPLLCICLSAPQVRSWPERKYGWMLGAVWMLDPDSWLESGSTVCR